MCVYACVCVCAHARTCMCMLICVQLFCDPVDCSPPGSSAHGVFQQEYWSGIKPASCALQVDSSPLVRATWVNGRINDSFPNDFIM